MYVYRLYISYDQRNIPLTKHANAQCIPGFPYFIHLKVAARTMEGAIAAGHYRAKDIGSKIHDRVTTLEIFYSQKVAYFFSTFIECRYVYL